MKYFAYHSPNGQITGYGSREPEFGKSAIEIDAPNIGPLAHYVDNGSVIPFPMCPSPNHIFDYTTKQWIDPRTLDDVKAEKWTAIKIAREVALISPLVTPFGVFDATVSAQKSITDAVLMLQTLSAMGIQQSIDFTLADNSTVTLSTIELIQVGLMLGQRTQITFTTARALRTAIDSSQSVAELELIVWPST